MDPTPYLATIRHIARLYHPKFLETEDLVQEAALALLQMPQTEEAGPAKARHCISSPHQNALRSVGGPISNPLPQSLGSTPSPLKGSEDGDSLVPSVVRSADASTALLLFIHRAMQAAIRRYEHPQNCSIDERLAEGVAPQEGGRTPPLPAIADLMEEGQLSERYRLVLTMHYGLDGGPAMRLREIGNVLGISENTVNSILYQATQKIEKMQKKRKNDEED